MSAMVQEQIHLTDLSTAQISEALGIEGYRGKQIFKWIHQKRVFDVESMTDLSKALRERLASECSVNRLTLVKESASPKSGTKKVLLRLDDGETVESVLLRDRDRVTLCISTQAGCPLKCSFCATGASGFARNLSPGEIVEQALFLLKDEDPGERTPNVVFMGMGEPFRNYDAVVAAVKLLMSEDGLGIGARKITVSTAGELPGIYAFAEEGWQVRLSVSLHAANDELRDELVPLNRRYDLTKLREAVEHYTERTGRQITFEWTLLEGVNDRPQDIEELSAYAGPLQAFVNLIPYNPVQGLPYRPPTRAACERFRAALIARGIKATLRVERGQDIDAACGQLRRLAG